MPEANLKRPHFFTGKLLTSGDFELEQNYSIERFKRHNRNLHGFGIVSGLEVGYSAGQILVKPGLALDCAGNEIVVPEPQVVEPPDSWDCASAYLNIRFVELKTAPLPDSDGEQFATTTESFELGFAKENCNRGHRHARGRWRVCGQLHELTIAKLRKGPRGWRVDRGYRPPVIK